MTPTGPYWPRTWELTSRRSSRQLAPDLRATSKKPRNASTARPGPSNGQVAGPAGVRVVGARAVATGVLVARALRDVDPPRGLHARQHNRPRPQIWQVPDEQ